MKEHWSNDGPYGHELVGVSNLIGKIFSHERRESMENPFELVQCPEYNRDSSGTVGPLLNRSDRRAWNISDSFGSVNSRTSQGYRNLNSNVSGYNELNFTFPCWDAADILKRDTFKEFVNDLNIYFTPIIIVVGATGNIMAFLVFTVTHLRRQSSSVFLASLALVDLGYLLTLLFGWLSWIKIHIVHKHVWCQMVLYMEAVFSFLSVW